MVPVIAVATGAAFTGIAVAGVEDFPPTFERAAEEGLRGGVVAHFIKQKSEAVHAVERAAMLGPECALEAVKRAVEERFSGGEIVLVAQ